MDTALNEKIINQEINNEVNESIKSNDNNKKLYIIAIIILLLVLALICGFLAASKDRIFPNSNNTNSTSSSSKTINSTSNNTVNNTTKTSSLNTATNSSISSSIGSSAVTTTNSSTATADNSTSSVTTANSNNITSKTYKDSYIEFNYPSDWQLSKNTDGSINITKGKYILYIVPRTTQTSGVVGGRFGEIAMGAPSADAVIQSWPRSCGSSEKVNLNSEIYRSDYFANNSSDCDTNPSGTENKWFFSYVSTIGDGYFGNLNKLNTTSGVKLGQFVITMSYNDKVANNLPTYESAKPSIEEMSTIVKSINWLGIGEQNDQSTTLNNYIVNEGRFIRFSYPEDWEVNVTPESGINKFEDINIVEISKGEKKVRLYRMLNGVGCPISDIVLPSNMNQVFRFGPDYAGSVGIVNNYTPSIVKELNANGNVMYFIYLNNSYKTEFEIYEKVAVTNNNKAMIEEIQKSYKSDDQYVFMNSCGYTKIGEYTFIISGFTYTTEEQFLKDKEIIETFINSFRKK